MVLVLEHDGHHSNVEPMENMDHENMQHEGHHDHHAMRALTGK